jgi:short-subunit dehydrogenase
MKVLNKLIMVTGAGSGMGREIVFGLLARGAKVVAIDINSQSLQETVALAGDKRDSIRSFVADITNRKAVEEMIKELLHQTAAVDGLINNAGIIQPFVKVNDLTYEAIDKVMNVNFYGTLYLTKTLLPHLLTRPESHIVNISSMGGFLPVPGQTLYGASKAAVKLLTEGLHSELAGTNVRVTVVFPGAVNTNIAKNSGLQMPESSTAENKSVKVLSSVKAAQIILDGMENNDYRVLVGRDARMMDLFYRLNPRSAAKLIADKMKGLLSR